MSQKIVPSILKRALEDDIQQLLQQTIAEILQQAETKLLQSSLTPTSDNIRTIMRSMMSGYHNDITKKLQKTSRQLIVLCRQGQISTHPLLRLASDRLYALCVESDDMAQEGKNLYPAVVPGICAAIETMLGDDQLKQWRRQYRDAKIKLNQKANQQAFQDLSIVKNYLFEELLLAIMPYFFKGQERYDWFFVHIEKNLKPIHDGNDDIHVPFWQYTMIDYKLTIVILYRSLFQQLRDIQKNQQLLKRIGYEKHQELQQLLALIGNL